MKHEFAFINLFRALAAFWVLAAHCMIWGGWYGLPLPSAKYAVDLFMLVSGFLMAANAASRWEREPLTDARSRLRFWTRRFFRIAPAYYLALLVVIVGADFFLSGKAELQALNRAQWPIGGPYDPQAIRFTVDNLLMHASFLFGLHPAYASATSLPDWSIGLEMQFYAAFPLLYLLLHKRGPVALVVAGFAVFALGRLVNVFVAYPEPSLLAFKLQYFIGGMLLYRTLAGGSLGSRVWMMAGALLLVSLEGIVAPALLLTMFALGALELADETPARLQAFIRSRVVTFASDVSYSVYLFQGLAVGTFGVLCLHSPWLRSLSLLERTGVLFAFVLVVAYAVAYAVYRCVELPGIALGKRLLARSGQHVVNLEQVDI